MLLMISSFPFDSRIRNDLFFCKLQSRCVRTECQQHVQEHQFFGSDRSFGGRRQSDGNRSTRRLGTDQTTPVGDHIFSGRSRPIPIRFAPLNTSINYWWNQLDAAYELLIFCSIHTYGVVVHITFAPFLSFRWLRNNFGRFWKEVGLFPNNLWIYLELFWFIVGFLD